MCSTFNRPVYESFVILEAATQKLDVKEMDNVANGRLTASCGLLVLANCAHMLA